MTDNNRSSTVRAVVEEPRGSESTATATAAEVQWFRSLTHHLRSAANPRVVAAFCSELFGGPPRSADELPREPADFVSLSAVVETLPQHLREEAERMLDELSKQVPSASEDPTTAVLRGGEPVFLRQGMLVLERSDSPPTMTHSDELSKHLSVLGLDNAVPLARVLSLVGANLDRHGFQNFGLLIEAQVIARTAGPKPDLAGYELKTLSAKATVDRPFIVIFGKAPARLASRQDLIARFSKNGRTVDFGKMRLGRNGRFRVVDSATHLYLETNEGERLLAWRWDELEERLQTKMARVVLLTLRRSTEERAVVRDAGVFLDPVRGAFHSIARSREFQLHVRLQERSGRDAFEFLLRTSALRKLYGRWISVRPA